MDVLILSFFEDPMRYIGYLFATLGMIGVLLFIMGFSGGIPHLFTFAESATHMEHARARIVWGLLWCMTVLGLWEVVRVIAGEAPLWYLAWSILLTSPLWIPALKGGKGGH